MHIECAKIQGFSMTLVEYIEYSLKIYLHRMSFRWSSKTIATPTFQQRCMLYLFLLSCFYSCPGSHNISITGLQKTCLAVRSLRSFFLRNRYQSSVLLKNEPLCMTIFATMTAELFTRQSCFFKLSFSSHGCLFDTF